MKKILKLLVVLSIFFIGVIGLTACSNAKAISSEEFQTAMENAGYEVSDITNEVDVQTALRADMLDENGNPLYSIAFYVYDSEDTAKSIFQNGLNNFAQYEDENSTIKNFESSNAERYTLLGQGYYTIISRIDNTLLFTDASDLYREDIIEISKELGY